VLPADYKGTALTVNSNFRGANPVALSLNRELLLRTLSLGFGKLEFTDSAGTAPITARGRGKDLFIMMPLMTGSTEKIIEAVRKSKNKTTVQRYAPENSSIKTITFENKKEKKMPEEIKRPPVFKVVEETESDPFVRLMQEITTTQEKAKAVVEHTKSLTRLIKDVQRDIKNKEKDFKHTRDLLGKLKKVSDF